MFKWRIISRSNINGKVHSFQKDFDDYDSYQEFIGVNPEYSPRNFLENFYTPWNLLNSFPQTLDAENRNTPIDTKYLPEGIDLSKYQNRRLEKRQTEAQKMEKKNSLEKTLAYLEEYLKENSDHTEAKDDIEKIKAELKNLE